MGMTDSLSPYRPGVRLHAAQNHPLSDDSDEDRDSHARDAGELTMRYPATRVQ
jgi:hypothetical protein